MKTALLPLATVTAMLVVAGVLVALVFGADDDGGGGGGGSLEAYFQTLNVAQTEISGEYSAISTQHPEAFVAKQDTIEYLDESAQAWAEGATKLEAIDPPSAAEDAHRGLIDATSAVSEAFAGLHEDAQDADDTEESLTALLDSADTSAFDNYDAACTTMQTLADENNILEVITC
jgi:hypothetical protein